MSPQIIPEENTITRHPDNYEKMTSPNLASSSNQIVNNETASEILDTQPIRRKSLGKITQIVKDQLPLLDDMSVKNYDELLESFRNLFEEASTISETYAKEYVEKAGAIEDALSTLAEYNRKALEQLSKLTKEAIDVAEEPKSDKDQDGMKIHETLVDKARALVRMAEQQLEYSKHIGEIARPLTLWRLDASKAVWKANEALKLAEIKLSEMKELEESRTRTAPYVSKLVSEQTNSQSEVKSTNLKITDSPAVKQIIKPIQSENSVSVSDEIQSQLDEDKTQLLIKELMSKKRQPIKFWPKRVYTTDEGQMICYVRAPEDCLPHKEYLQCSLSDLCAPWPNIPGQHELIGQIVTIYPIPKKDMLILPNEPWIIGVPHNFGKVAAREAVLFAIECGKQDSHTHEKDNKVVHPLEFAHWRDIHTTDVIIDEQHYLEVRLSKLTPITFAPCVRLRRDMANIGRAGGRLLSLTDPRITLTAPMGALKCDLPFALQVQQLDPVQLIALRDQNQTFMKDFVSCSPLVYLTCATRTLFKPITITVPYVDGQLVNTSAVPPAMVDRMTNERRNEKSIYSEENISYSVNKTSISAVYDGFQKSLLLPQLLAGPRTENAEISVMRKLNVRDADWTPWSEVERGDDTAETVSFNLKRIETCKFIVLRTKTTTDPDILCRCATLLERSLSQHLVYFTVCQNQKQAYNFCLLLVLPDQLENGLQQLREEGFNEVDKPYGPVFLDERQQLDITFHSNIRLVGEGNKPKKKSCGGMKLKFSSTIVNRNYFTVEPADSNAQIGLDQYRGFLDIYCMRETITNAQPEKPPAYVPDDLQNHRQSIMAPRVRKPRYKIIKERTHLARLVIKVPKYPNINSPIPTKFHFEFEPKDVITNKYLKELSRKLTADTWRRLGAALGLSRSRIQTIGGKAVYGSEDQAYTMLITWIKTLPISADRVGLLHQALITIGRPDLANELREQNMDYVNEDSDSYSNS